MPGRCLRWVWPAHVRSLRDPDGRAAAATGASTFRPPGTFLPGARPLHAPQAARVCWAQDLDLLGLFTHDGSTPDLHSQPPALKEAGDLTISLARLGQSLIHLKTKKCSWRITGPEVTFFSQKKIEWGIRGRLKELALGRRECYYFNRRVLRASAVLGPGKSSGEQGVCGVCFPSLSLLKEVDILYS